MLDDTGDFNRESAERAATERREEIVEEESSEPSPADVDTSSEEPEKIDYSCFDELNSDRYASLSETERKDILAQCERAYDVSLEDFAKLGDFHDPETNRYHGDTYHEGMDGAKRGVNQIVQSVLDAERWQGEVSKLESEVAKYRGVRGFFKRLFQKDKMRDTENKLHHAKFQLEFTKKWPDHIGSLAFDDDREKSLAIFHSDEVQTKYKHLIQMKRDIKTKYHVS